MTGGSNEGRRSAPKPCWSRPCRLGIGRIGSTQRHMLQCSNAEGLGQASDMSQGHRKARLHCTRAHFQVIAPTIFEPRPGVRHESGMQWHKLCPCHRRSLRCRSRILSCVGPHGPALSQQVGPTASISIRFRALRCDFLPCWGRAASPPRPCRCPSAHSSARPKARRRRHLAPAAAQLAHRCPLRKMLVGVPHVETCTFASRMAACRCALHRKQRTSFMSRRMCSKCMAAFGLARPCVGAPCRQRMRHVKGTTSSSGFLTEQGARRASLRRGARWRVAHATGGGGRSGSAGLCACRRVLPLVASLNPRS